MCAITGGLALYFLQLKGKGYYLNLIVEIVKS